MLNTLQAIFELVRKSCVVGEIKIQSYVERKRRSGYDLKKPAYINVDLLILRKCVQARYQADRSILIAFLCRAEYAGWSYGRRPWRGGCLVRIFVDVRKISQLTSDLLAFLRIGEDADIAIPTVKIWRLGTEL